MLCADGFTHQHRAYRPLTAEPQTLQAAAEEQLPETLRKAAQEGEHGKPDNRDMKDSYASEAVSQQAGQPAADRGHQQSRGAQPTGIALADVPGGDQAGDDEAVNHDVHTVQGPATEGRNQGALFF